MSKKICKSEDCLVCDHMLSSKEEDGELDIACELEIDGYEDDEELETCPEFQSNKRTVTLGSSSGNNDKGLASRHYDQKTESPKETNMAADISEERINKYIFVGDSLVESKRGDYELPGALVEAWNQKVAELKRNTQVQIVQLTNKLSEDLEAAKTRLQETSGAVGVIDELFSDELPDQEYEQEDLYDPSGLLGTEYEEDEIEDLDGKDDGNDDSDEIDLERDLAGDEEDDDSDY